MASLDAASFAALDQEGLTGFRVSPTAQLLNLSSLFGAFSPSTGEWITHFRNVDGWANNSEKFFRDNFTLLFISLCLYLPVIFLGRRLMEDRKPFDLRVPLILWNFAMAAFSLLGTVYLVPIYSRVFTDVGWWNGVCSRWCFAYNEEAFLIFLFDLSKMLEFVDTIFIVLRKKPLIFLHYYHHVVTMSFCWLMNQTSHYYGCHGYQFAMLNFFVHFVMYSYYGLMACRIRMPKWVSTAITTMQIVQMVIGIGIVTTLGLCERTDVVTVTSGALLYFSFFCLFAQFFYKRYVSSKPPAKAAPAREPAAGTKRKTM